MKLKEKICLLLKKLDYRYVENVRLHPKVLEVALLMQERLEKKNSLDRITFGGIKEGWYYEETYVFVDAIEKAIPKLRDALFDRNRKLAKKIVTDIANHSLFILDKQNDLDAKREKKTI